MKRTIALSLTLCMAIGTLGALTGCREQKRTPGTAGTGGSGEATALPGTQTATGTLGTQGGPDGPEGPTVTTTRPEGYKPAPIPQGVLEASFTRNPDGTCTDTASGTVFLDDELDSLDRRASHGDGLTVDSSNPGLFEGDAGRVTRLGNASGDQCYLVYRLDAGITEVCVKIAVYEKADPNATPTVSVSTDGESWTDAGAVRDGRIDLGSDSWAMYTVTAAGIDPANKFVKIDLGPAPDSGDWCWNVNLCRVRINNIAKMDDPDRFLEIRESAAFYLDSEGGSDENDGRSEATAFKSLSKIGEIFLQPGDRVLFKRGCTFSGALTLRGYGDDDCPIWVGDYGSDGNPAKLDGHGANKAVTVSAMNIILSGLEITNPDGAFGIYIQGLQAGENPGITVADCYIHDVDVEEKNFNYVTGGGIVAYATGNSPTWFKGLAVQNNTIKNVCRCAVVISTAWGWRFQEEGAAWIKNRYVNDSEGWYPNIDCLVSGNAITGAKGDSVLIQCGKNTLLEHNTIYNSNASTKEHANTAMVAMWTCSTVDSVMQYNEVGYTRRTVADGEAFDSDHSDVNCLIQYNYSHNNEGGFVLICNGYPGTASGATVRYNLSVNDGEKGASVELIGTVPGTKIYNNTFYLAPTSATVGMWGNDGAPYKAEDVTFTNNIFAASKAKSGSFYCGGSVGEDFYKAVENVTFEHNLFYNVLLPSSRGGVTATGSRTDNPKFALSTDYDDRSSMIAGFTPRANPSGAVSVPDNGGKDINGDPLTGDFFGCVNPK